MRAEGFEKDIQGMANFEFEKEAPPLPIRINYEKINSLDWTDVRLHNGTFSSGFEFDQDRFIKLSRTGYLQNVGAEDNPEFSLQDTKFLVERTKSKIIPPAEALNYSEEQIAGLMNSETVDDFNRMRVEFSLERLAREKLETYHKLKHYLGENMPDYYGSAIVKSPRRKIEQKRGNVQAYYWPETEITLMEVWENIDPRTQIEGRGLQGLLIFSKQEHYAEQMKVFGEKALALLEDGGIALDLCDMAGIRGYTSSGEKQNIKEFSDVCNYFDGKPEPAYIYARNTAFDGKKVTYFDTYPVEDITKKISRDTLLKIRDAVVQKNKQKLEEVYAFDRFNGKPISGRTLAHCTRYYILLEKMGVDLKRTTPEVS